MSDDVVAELDRWLAVWFSHFGGTQSVDMEVVQRARTEIVALRAKCIELSADRTRQLVADRRAKVLEEAARVCDEPARRLREELGWSAEADLLERYAAAIRALKNKDH